MKKFLIVIICAGGVFRAAAQGFTYNTTIFFSKTLAAGVTDTFYVQFPPASGGKWIPYDTTTGYNLTTKPLQSESRWTGAGALGVKLYSGNTCDSVKIQAASLGRTTSQVGIDENTQTYLAGSASGWSNDVLDNSFHSYTVTALFDPVPGLAFIIQIGDVTGGERRVDFYFRYRR